MQYNHNIMEKNLKSKLLPFVLTAVIIVLDQITKLLVVRYIDYYTIGKSFLGGFINLIHVYNTGVAFSMGSSWGVFLRFVMFRLVPLVIIGIVIAVYFRNNEFSKLQRWSICGIIGGGLGNLIDRFFRPLGVVDFIDCKFFRIPGITPSGRWPTFNVADSAVVVCGIILLISFIKLTIEDEKKAKKKESK